MELFEPLDPMFAISLDLPCERKYYSVCAAQQRLYLRPLPQGQGSLRPTFFLLGVLATLAGSLRTFQNSYVPLMT